MTYQQPPVCRKGGGPLAGRGCSEPAVEDSNLVEGDRNLCFEHLGEVRARRHGLPEPKASRARPGVRESKAVA
jgi:hypothetical protein